MDNPNKDEIIYAEPTETEEFLKTNEDGKEEVYIRAFFEDGGIAEYPKNGEPVRQILYEPPREDLNAKKEPTETEIIMMALSDIYEEIAQLKGGR